MPKTRIVFVLKKKKKERKICFAYTTLIFKFIAHQLNIINKLPKDECSKMLMNNFFIDHLIKTRNSADKLIHLYKNL